jgi:hypothetical protein
MPARPMQRAGLRTAGQLFLALVVALCACGLGRPPAAHAAMTYVVRTTADSGGNSLRWAIQSANLNPGPDNISFNIPGSGPFVIRPLTPLPEITGPVVLDGTTQPGFSGTPVIEIDGSRVIYSALTVRAGGSGSTIRGLVINRLDQTTGISLIDSNQNLIAGNFIGTNPAGTAVSGQQVFGIAVTRGSGNLIGGGAVRDRNVIAGGYGPGGAAIVIEGQNNTVRGNFIGTNASGTAALPGKGDGVQIRNSSRNTIGPGNVISGYLDDGVEIMTWDSGFPATENVVKGNLIGVDVSGTIALPNGDAGVQISGSKNLIGGTGQGDRNVISGNSGNGVLIAPFGTSGTQPTGNRLQGNYIGTNAAGMVALPNGLNGVRIEGKAFETFIGGNYAVDRNVISGNNRNGIEIYFNEANPIPGAHVVWGNYIGTNAQGTVAVPNRQNGVRVEGATLYTMIGGYLGLNGNVISGNDNTGITLSFAQFTVIQNNAIGLAAGGVEAPLPNGWDGIRVESGTQNDIESNRIGFNNLSGVQVGGIGSGNLILSNSIFENGMLGIDIIEPYDVNPNDEYDLDSGANGMQNYPVIAAGVAGLETAPVYGTLDSEPNGHYLIQFFVNPDCDSLYGHGEGRRYLGAVEVVIDDKGHGDFLVRDLPARPGDVITATATNQATNDTSEFSACTVVPVK